MTSDELSKSSSTIRRDGDDQGTNRISLDTLWDLLANAHRRHILLYLSEHTKTTISREQLLDHLTEVSDRSYKDLHRRLAIRLHHVHLPKLADHGLLVYNEATHSISYNANSRVEKMLDVVRDISSEKEK
ncbi:hypothetical protein BG842_07725 [Haladaptatus sp. W1]|uniref:DUF7344 domain-containing protein n=1 Tax=Haladaptatus sp. W1 TaxID=1897478 RepID=UPI00084989A4|nr:hypothetical protein [Haladaptatus sp. W1]ODR80340.1 hypothetical protein BG842_07725 [Haladaptatus sp. W1]